MRGRTKLREASSRMTIVAVFVVTMASLPALPVDAQSQTMQRILYGEVVSAERITIRDAPTGRGAQAGSTVGAVAGYALADGRDRWLGALVGGVLGGAAGNAAAGQPADVEHHVALFDPPFRVGLFPKHGG